LRRRPTRIAADLNTVEGIDLHSATALYAITANKNPDRV
jgi:hypothetical protein